MSRLPAPLFFVESLAGPQVRLSPRDSRHAVRSLRLRPGDGLTLADARGTVAAGRLAEHRGGLAVVEVGERRRVARPRPVVSVALAPPKGDRLLWAVQKLGELGVDETVLMGTERSVRAWDPVRAGRALERLRVVAREAAMQSRQPFVMELRAGASLDDVVDPADGPVLVLWEGAGEPLSRLVAADAPRVRLVVGPEGGFSEPEVDRARAAGAALATLGPAVLRTETAAVVAAALALARVGRLG